MDCEEFNAIYQITRLLKKDFTIQECDLESLKSIESDDFVSKYMETIQNNSWLVNKNNKTKNEYNEDI